MMLRALLPELEHRYAFAGVLAGTIFPIANHFTGAFPATVTAVTALAPILGGLVLHRLGRTRSQLIEERQARDEASGHLLHQVNHDRLTGLGNRFALEQLILGVLSAGKAADRIALLLLDLNKFKFINDTMGHDAGDALLTGVAQRLREVTGASGSVFRLGGDEFVVTVPGSPSLGKITDMCGAIADAFSHPFDISGVRIHAGISLGATFLYADDSSMSAILKRADLALYKAKDHPGNSFELFKPAMALEAAGRREIEQGLSRALQNGEFFLEYQPIVGVESRAVRSFEALLRWRHPEKGIIQPDAFIPAAERSGLILPIGNWVIRTACAEAARWPAPTGVAVNVAGDQFRDADFVSYIKRCLAEARLAPGRLTIEVTESIFSVDPAQIRESLAELRAHGVRVALDDFGIGFSSINNLRSFPLDQLKIDRSFAGAMLANKRDAELIDLILKLGNMFQVTTTIEGIETEGQLDFIRGLGAAEAQGFLISRPVPAHDVIRFLVPAPAATQAVTA